VGIELLFNFTKSHVVMVLPTANQMNWSQMELSFASSPVTSSVGRAPTGSHPRWNGAHVAIHRNYIL